MDQMFLWLRASMLTTWRAIKAAPSDDRGTVVETVVIAAALATLAITVMAAIKLLVDNKVAGISL